MKKSILLLAGIFLVNSISFAQKNKQEQEDRALMKSSTYSSFKWREIGPALTSGRIADIAVNPENFNE